jgi:dipeptidyl aminopeptidase/acylaminoacyl peptidase
MVQFAWIPSGGEQLAASIDWPDEATVAAPWPVVVVCHGLTGQRLGRGYHLVQFGRMLADRGIACVRFDQAGCGESTGRFVDLTLPRMQADTEAVRRWLEAQPWAETERLGLVGLSLGALPAVGAEANAPAAGLALWAPVYDMPRTFHATAKTGLRALLEHQGFVPYRGLPVGKGFVDQLDAIQPHDLLAKSHSPILLFHSKADDTVPVSEGEAYVERCQAIDRPCEFVRFSTANHDFSDYEDRQSVLSRTADFFEQLLLAKQAPDQTANA